MNLHKICLANYGEKSTIHEAADGYLKKKLIMTVESSKGSSGLSSVSSNEEVSKVNIRWFGRCYWHMITRHSFAGRKSFVV